MGVAIMKSYEQHVPVLDFLFRKPDVNTTESPETPEIMEDSVWDVYNDLQSSKVQLSERVATLQMQNKELEAYATTVAHDLKEPLSILILTSNLITKIHDMPRDELKEYLLQIKSTAYQMNAIISALLFFAKVSRAEAPVERVDMGWIVKKVRNRLSHVINEYQARLDLPRSWPDAIGYAPWLEEVWTNYINNALKHGGRPPRVELGASTQPDGMIRFWARDNGPGLPPEVQARLFAPFNQTSSVDTSGEGLGLSIVFRIIQKLGGCVGVESEVGKGSQFFFTLPSTPAS
jgi:signal transduction histidine kinase